LNYLMRWLLFLAMYMPISAWATVQVEGVSVPVRTVVDGQMLMLNGAGVRSVFIFDIYVAALYLPERTGDARYVVREERPVRVSLHFLRGGAGRGLFARGWRSGFEHNQSPADMTRLETRLKRFNAMFSEVGKGDVFTFDFLMDHSTRISINGVRRGMISGSDFQRALLGVWLGKYPADQSLKRAMLKSESS